MEKIGLQPEIINEIADWIKINAELKEALRVHTTGCGHWGFARTWKEQHREPNFPDYDMAECAYCGKTIKC
jgi:hypothetical protein